MLRNAGPGLSPPRLERRQIIPTPPPPSASGNRRMRTAQIIVALCFLLAEDKSLTFESEPTRDWN